MERVKVNDGQAAFLTLMKEFIESYALNHDNMPLNEWLSMELQSHMPEKSATEIEAMTSGIISSLELTKSKREALDKAMKSGMTKEGWFAREVKKSSDNAENEQKLTQDLHNAAIHAQAEILGIDDKGINDTVHATPNETARQIENAAVMGSTIDAEFCDVAGEVLNDDEYQHGEFIAESLKTGNDTGIKAATAGAIRSAAEKKLIPFMPESTCVGVAYMALEKVKAALKKAPLVEYIEAVERNALAVAGGYIAVSKGASIGAKVGSMFGFAGTLAGGIIGAGTGYIAGSKIAYAVAGKFQEVRRRVTDNIEIYAAPVFKKAVETVKSIGKKVFSKLFG